MLKGLGLLLHKLEHITARDLSLSSTKDILIHKTTQKSTPQAPRSVINHCRKPHTSLYKWLQ